MEELKSEFLKTTNLQGSRFGKDFKKMQGSLIPGCNWAANLIQTLQVSQVPLLSYLPTGNL